MARRFNGSTDKIVYSASSPITGYPLTLFARFRITSFAASHALFKLRVVTTANPDGHLIIITNTGLARAVTFSGGTSVNAETLNSISTADRSWHSCLGVFANATSRDIYLDNGAAGSNATSKTDVALTQIEFGFRGEDGGQNSGHDIAEMAAWNVADLTAEERWRLHFGHSPEQIRPTALKIYSSLRDSVHAQRLAQWFTVTGTQVVDHPPVIVRARRLIHPLTPLVPFGVTAGAVTFNASWNAGANTMIQPGAIVA